MELTYLHHCLKKGLTVRWPDSAMPLNVYVAPFQWYEKAKQQESLGYRQMVLDALDTWSAVSAGKVRFRLVNTLQDSQIDIKWRRVDRKSLGHCEYMINDRSLLYSAEIQIGISDGILHARYNDVDEVKHTILHEVGHALGLVGHSDHPADMMYVPHQYGVVHLSPRDIETLRLLYKLPVAFNYLEAGRKRQLPEPFSFHQVVEQIGKASSAASPGRFSLQQKKAQEQPEKLLQQHQILSQKGRFYLSTQNIQLDPELRRAFLERKINPPTPPSADPA